MSPSNTLANRIDVVIKPYRRAIPAMAALFVSLLVGSSIIIAEMRSDSRLIRALNPQVSSLVETNDRPELERLAKSVVKDENRAFVVVKNGIVLASSQGYAHLDRPYQLPRAVSLGAERSIGIDGLITRAEARRPDGPADLDAQIIMITPLKSIALWSGFAALLVLILGLLVGSTFAERIQSAVTEAVSVRPGGGQSLRPSARWSDHLQHIRAWWSLL